jgi:polysaccharide export outer membrane protein
MRTFFLALALAGSLFGCSSAYPDAPLYATDDPEFHQAEVIKVPGLDSDPPQQMTLLPGDIVGLRVLSPDGIEAAGLVVDEKGVLPVPLAGEVIVAGLTLEQARRSVEEAIQKYDKFARAVVTVSEAAGHRATVVGAVEKPGAYIVRPNMRLAELVALTGGPRTVAYESDLFEMADLDAGRVVRAGVALPVSIGRALEGDPRHNVRVHPGDLVFMPTARSRVISVLGEVQRPTAVGYYRGLRLTEAIARAGGATDDADNGDVRVIRGPLSKPKVYTASIKALRNGNGRDVLLEPGDVVYVTEHWFATTTDVLQRLTPAIAGAAVGTAFYLQTRGASQ